MKAVVISQFGGPEVLEIKEIPIPSPLKQQVLIRVVATSVNYADVQTRQGLYHAAGKPPIIPGLDAVGVIEQLGEGVSQFQVGDRVVAFPKGGTYAEWVIADENLTFRLPQQVSFLKAAASPLVAFTSLQLLTNVAKIQPGESVLIHAASGGIGTTAIQLAKHLGATPIIGVVGRESKRNAAKDAGADYVICSDCVDFVEEVNRITKDKGVDVILDSISGSYTKRNLSCLALFGRLVVFGHASGETGYAETRPLHSGCRSVLGFSFGTVRNQHPELLKDTGIQVMNYLANDQLQIPIGAVYPLTQSTLAHERMESRENTGKIVLVVREDLL